MYSFHKLKIIINIKKVETKCRCCSQRESARMPGALLAVSLNTVLQKAPEYEIPGFLFGSLNQRAFFNTYSSGPLLLNCKIKLPGNSIFVCNPSELFTEWVLIQTHKNLSVD